MYRLDRQSMQANMFNKLYISALDFSCTVQVQALNVCAISEMEGG